MHLLVDQYLDCFCLLTMMNNSALNLYVEIFVWTYDFISLGCIIPRKETAGSYGNLMFNYLKIFPQSICIILHFLPAMYEGSNISTSSQYYWTFKF